MDKKDIADKLLTGNFEKSTNIVSQLSDPIVPTPMVVTIDQLRTYESNPRIKKNPKYEELKTSILNRGFDATPQITRRPEQDHYIVRNGFNTRLTILNELWKETKDEKFYKILCLFHPWQNEITVLTGHLTENDLRGELTFIERALSIKKAKALYEKDIGRELAQRELAELLTHDGYPIKQPNVSRMQDTVDFLLPVIPNALYSGMSSRQAQKLLTLRRHAKTIYEKYTNDSRDELIQIYMDVLSTFDDDFNMFNFNRFQDELIGQMSGVLKITYNLLALEFENKSVSIDVDIENLEAEIGLKKLFIDPALIEIDEAKLLSKLPINIADLTEDEIINFPMPRTPRSIKSEEPTNKYSSGDLSNFEKNKDVSEPVSFSHETEFNVNDDIFSNEPVSTDTSEHLNFSISPKVDAIKKTIAEITEAGYEGGNFTQLVPATSGFFPVNDIWFISPELEDSKRLQAHIGQLVYEIANELGAGESIEITENKFGFNCLDRPQVNESAQVLLNILTELSSSRSNLSALLIGTKAAEDIHRLTDNAIIQLFRAIRLARKLSELEKVI